MWPFSRKSRTPLPTVTVAQALDQLPGLGIHVRSGVTQEDLLLTLEGTMESPVDWVSLLCVLGSEVERRPFQRMSDDIWHFDAECIEDDGDYARVAERFVILTKGLLPLKDLRDRVDIENETAW